jgi:flavodoxin
MKSLVAYFSAQGETERYAKQLAEAADAAIFRILPLKPYTEADLDWNDPDCRSTVEMKNKSFRPEVINRVEGIENFDVIFLGFPIWWYVAPTIINTFLEQYDLEGKTIVPFFTSSSSPAGRTLFFLQKSAPKANWKEPVRVNAYDKAKIKALADSVSK